mmetsp:Transcript_20884/g.61016  ORF Transcript_20884/g.61016 Transcript_20884/m.61016 type:complete len:220 (-) Transcript_20884:384-1043(-)
MTPPSARLGNSGRGWVPTPWSRRHCTVCATMSATEALPECKCQSVISKYRARFSFVRGSPDELALADIPGTVSSSSRRAFNVDWRNSVSDRVGLQGSVASWCCWAGGSTFLAPPGRWKNLVSQPQRRPLLPCLSTITGLCRLVRLPSRPPPRRSQKNLCRASSPTSGGLLRGSPADAAVEFPDENLDSFHAVIASHAASSSSKLKSGKYGSSASSPHPT